MNTVKVSLVLVLFLVGFQFQMNAQQLLINEVSQGTGSKEYVEFVVVGTPTCITPVPCIDLRGMVIDDNNGEFASGSGTGIANGAVRFANIPFWSCVPQGTLIVVYNNTDINPLLPADDLSLTDGNCRLVIPINSVLFEAQSISPTSVLSTYPLSAASWTAGAGDWNQLAMANSNDSFQIRQSTSSASALHAVSWGNNSNNTQIYFTGSAAGRVYSMMNVTNNNAFVQSNWVSGAVGVNETPGVANSAANDAWIGSMNPQCGVANTMILTMASTPTGCGGMCSGTAGVAISGGTSPYAYSWSNGGTIANLSALCAGTYTVTVTDANNCQATDQVTVTNSASTISVSLTPVNVTCNGNCNGSITSSVSGSSGTVSYLWSNAAITQNISGLCSGNYSVTVLDQAGCSATASTTITGAGNLQVAMNSTNETCLGSCNGTTSATVTGGASPYTYLWSNTATTSSLSSLCPASYSVTITDQAGCSVTGSSSVLVGPSSSDATISTTGTIGNTDAPSQFVSTTSGGTWTADCGSCMTSAGIFNPAGLTPGLYEVCHTVGVAPCDDNDCVTITVVQGCTPQTTSETITVCAGQSIQFNGQTYITPGTYSGLFTGANGCDSTHTITLNNYITTPLFTTYSLCLDDSILINGSWYFNDATVVEPIIDMNGCNSIKTHTITFEDCAIPDFAVFIPNTFTPNGDFTNDLFPLSIVGGVLESGFILNRWGEIIHEFKQDNLNWDGTTRQGLICQDGVYTYVVRVNQLNGKRHEYHGFVTLVR